MALAGGKQDATVQGNYSHVNGINGASFLVSIPLPIFNRNQGEIARTRYVITQMQEQQRAANQQVMTDVNDAYQGLRQNQEIMQVYESGYREEAKKDRDISEYAYQRGGVSLLDFLDAERAPIARSSWAIASHLPRGWLHSSSCAKPLVRGRYRRRVRLIS